MKKISRIEYCAGFEPLQSGMEQDEGSRILLLAMRTLLHTMYNKHTIGMYDYTYQKYVCQLIFEKNKKRGKTFHVLPRINLS